MHPTYLDIVNWMDLEEGHVLTAEEVEAIGECFREAMALDTIRRALGLPDALDRLSDDA